MRAAALVSVLAFAGCSKALVDDTGAGTPPSGPTPDASVFPDATPLPPLSVDYADPDHGPFVGGTQVILRGRGFAEGMTVRVGGKRVADGDLEVIDAHRVSIQTPAGVPGPATIDVVAGNNQATREAAFLYEPIYLEPSSGSTSGGTYVRIRGLGTSFHDTDTVTLDGAPLTGVLIVNGQELTGYTPSGIAGDADLRIRSQDGSELFAEAAFQYQTTVDGFNGGFAGGPIDGTINVTIVDAYTGDGVPNATVVLGDPATSPFQSVTDPFGAVTFSAPGLRGPVTLTAGHPKYESGAMIGFDARNVSMFLTPLPPDPSEIPPSGPFPPGRAGATASGEIVFGNSTAIGSDTSWSLVPEPTSPTAFKRTYVFPTTRDIFGATINAGPGGTIDFSSGEGSWQYSIPVSPRAFALVAVAGIYDPNLDPDGPGPLPKGTFTPYAMGVRRNVLAGPGDNLQDLAIDVNIPLDTGILVMLPDAPDVSEAGPDEYHVNALIDLGGEGVIRLPGGRAVFRDGKSTIMTGLAPLILSISDASYSIVAGAYTQATSAPYSVRVVRGVRDLARPIVIDDFLGVTRFTDPPPEGVTSVRHLQVTPEGGSAVPTLSYQRLVTTDGVPVWRVIARGDLVDLPLYDLEPLGLPPMTTDQLYWTVYTITLPGETFDTFNYGKLNVNRWSAYTYAYTHVAFERP